MKVKKLQVGLVVQTRLDFGITLWQAIKLRLAGKGYETIANRMVDEFLKEKARPQTQD